MNDNFKLLDEHFDKGQAELIFSIKSLLYKKHPSLFEKLDLDDDRIFSEPLLFGFFTQNEKLMSLDQILFGYIKDELKPKQFEVFVDEWGIVYLPNYGYLKTSVYSQRIILKWEKSSASLFNKEDKEITFSFKHLLFLKECPEIEVCLHTNPIYTEILREWEQTQTKEYKRTGKRPSYRDSYQETYNFIESIEQNTLKILNNLELGFLILKNSCPDEYDRYRKTIRRVVCYENPFIQGFATKNVHGTIFLSNESTSNETFFIEEIVHQSSHNVFNAITSKSTDYFKIDKNTPFKNLILSTNKNEEYRGFYSAFHGLYTVSNGVKILTSIYNSNYIEKEKAHEFLGRLVIKKLRFKNRIQSIDFKKVFTDTGKDIYDLLNQSCQKTMEENPNIFHVKLDFSNQLFAFSYKKFKELNPI